MIPPLCGLQYKKQLRKVGNNNFTKITEFTLDIEDAKQFLYSKSTKHRVHKWNELSVSIYI